MLSRVADNLYWMSRYLERAEHTMRVVDVNMTLSLEPSMVFPSQRLFRVLASLSLPISRTNVTDFSSLTELLTLDRENPSSIISCITNARENARQVREQISQEMWEHLNRIYLQIQEATPQIVWLERPYNFFRAIKEAAQLFQGITDSTMSHAEGRHFILLGRYLERANATCALLQTHFSPFLDFQETHPGAKDYSEWVGPLKSCAAFESYCKVCSPYLEPVPIVEFLLLNKDFPRSVRFALDRVGHSLDAIAMAAGKANNDRLTKIVGEFQSQLDGVRTQEILQSGFRSFLGTLRQGCSEIHDLLHNACIAYPIETAALLGAS